MGVYHHLWLGERRLQIVEMEVIVVGEEADASSVSARQAVQALLDCRTGSGHHA